uniref:Phage protein n=1 Tax=Rhabditophanes sp. KR3021 TaxID=114890 RepID=A0AC35UCM6_9BILA
MIKKIEIPSPVGYYDDYSTEETTISVIAANDIFRLKKHFRFRNCVGFLSEAEEFNSNRDAESIKNELDDLNVGKITCDIYIMINPDIVHLTSYLLKMQRNMYYM